MSDSRISDSHYLRQSQYRTSDNLTARIVLNQRFATNPIDWFAWLRAQIELAPGARLLEVGAGPGRLWQDAPAAAPLLTDLSRGMLVEARQRVPTAQVAVADAQALPFPSAAFDRVTANHMLYHVPDMDRAAAELRRVLRPDGLLVAATNGRANLAEIEALVSAALPDAPPFGRDQQRYCLENAAAVLQPHFARVAIRRFESDLLVTELEPLLAYLRSRWALAELDAAAWGRLEAAATAAFAASGGALPITRAQGAVLAWPHAAGGAG
jgi:SAM-dependent methyltransferase